MRGLADIHLDVRGDDIIVDLPGTSYTVTYHKPAVSPKLLATYLPGENDPRTELTQAEHQTAGQIVFSQYILDLFISGTCAPIQ